MTTTNQTERHALGREGEAIIEAKLGGAKTAHKAPFDVVDFEMGIAYEVKTISGESVDKKVHIANGSMARKLAFARKHGLKKVLIAVVVYGPDNVQVYRSALKPSVRVSQMRRVK